MKNFMEPSSIRRRQEGGAEPDFSSLGYFAQRWIYKKLMTRRAINAGLLGNLHIKRHQFAEPAALRRTECTSRACGVNASLRVRPSTRPSGAVVRAACKSCSRTLSLR